MDGSSTVFPITEVMAEEFGHVPNGNVRITVGVSGTGGSFKSSAPGKRTYRTPPGPSSSRRLTCGAENGIEYIELPVAIDGLSVMVNPANSFVECMTVDELHTVWAPGAEGVVMSGARFGRAGRRKTSGYVAADALNQPHVIAFVEFYLDEASRSFVGETGCIPFPKVIYDLALNKFLDGNTGPAFGGDNRMSSMVEEVLRASS